MELRYRAPVAVVDELARREPREHRRQSLEQIRAAEQEAFALECAVANFLAGKRTGIRHPRKRLRALLSGR